MNDTYIGRNSGFVLDLGTLTGPFLDQALACITELPPGEYGADELRATVSGAGSTVPHPNLWGVLIAQAKRRGLLYDTGRTCLSIFKQNNGRRVRVWDRVAVAA